MYRATAWGPAAAAALFLTGCNFGAVQSSTFSPAPTGGTTTSASSTTGGVTLGGDAPTTTGGATTSTSGTTGGNSSTTGSTVNLYQAVTPSVYVAKVKNLLVGLAPTNDELNAVNADPDALGGLIDQWITTPQYTAKMMTFFGNAFQQSQAQMGDYQNQSNLGVGYGYDDLFGNLQQSFARTALELIAEGRPFNEALSTQRYMVTTPMLMYYAYLDTYHLDDNNNPVDLVTQQNPSFDWTIENSAGPIDPAQSADPTSANYQTYYVPPPAPTANCPTTDPFHYPMASPPNPGLVFSLYQYFFGSSFHYGGIANMGDCYIAVPDSPFSGADYNTWRMVNFRQPQPGEATTKFWNLPFLRSTSEVVLNIPRVSFFTTSAFMAGWPTNESNQGRVTINQTLIVALNHAFDGTNSIAPPSLAALDAEHAPPGSVCFGCHETLDPMRQFFRHDYTLFYHEQTDPNQLSLPGMFAFDGVSKAGSSIYDLAAGLASHPRFARAWTQKVCTYATSGICDETDPEFLRIAAAFTASNYNWNVLIHQVFSSPLVTYAQQTQTAMNQGVPVVIARRDHLCATLSNRLNLPDVCSLQILPDRRGAANFGLSKTEFIATALPADSYSRGQVAAVQARDPSLFIRSGVENMCIEIAGVVVDGSHTQFSSSDVPTAIASMVHNLMAIGPDRDTVPLSILQAHYNAALQTGVSASDALRSTFVLACTAPSTVGIGL